MNDEERADWLARAIDDLLNRDRQRPTEPPPPELERQELNTLLRIAGERIESSNMLMQTGLQYEGEVWQGVLHKLDRRRKPRKKPHARNKILPDDQSVLENPAQFEIDELREIAKMRREVAEQASAIAEAHRDDVWQRVQSRLEATPEERPRRRLPFFWRKGGRNTPAARDAATAAELSLEDSAEMESLMDVVRTRRYWSQLVQNAASGRQEGIWAGVTRTITKDKRYKDDKQDEQTPRGAWWPRAAAAAAVGAILIAAVGPLPATGFADHPFAVAGRSLAEHVGVLETGAPPAVGAEEALALAGREVTPIEASALIGVALAVPPAPEGYALSASRFFEEALTAESAGVFALIYAGPEEGSVVVYQERASGAELAVEGGSAADVVLADGTAGTYVAGLWEPADGGLTWSDSGGQMLVFERRGVRTTVQYTGPEASAPSLFAVADSMAATAE